MSALDELDERFGVRAPLKAAIRARFGPETWRIDFSARWWPERERPTAALVGAYDGTTAAPARAPRSWYLVGPNRVDPVGDDRLARMVEFLSPIPHDAAPRFADVFEFFGLGVPLRTAPQMLSSSEFAQVWHRPAIEHGRLVFFYRPEGGGPFHRVSVDLTTARVEDMAL